MGCWGRRWPERLFVALALEDTGALTFGGIVVGEPAGVLVSPAVPRRCVVRAADLLALERWSHAVDRPLALDFMEECHPRLARFASIQGFPLSRHAMLARTPSQRVVPAGTTILRADPGALVAAHRLSAAVFGQDQRVSHELAELLVARSQRATFVVAVAGPPLAPWATAAYRRSGPDAELVDVATRPSSRNLGLATMVLARLESHAAAAGVSRLVAVARDQASADWYRHRGYVETGTLVALRARPVR